MFPSLPFSGSLSKALLLSFTDKEGEAAGGEGTGSESDSKCGPGGVKLFSLLYRQRVGKSPFWAASQTSDAKDWS